MLKIGITGGIGSGKTIISRIFNVLGIPVFNADTAAKKLMKDHPELVKAITGAFGEEAYQQDGTLNRSFLSGRVFNDETELKKLNGLVHPVVIQAAEDWSAAQQAPYTLKEAALLFESGSYKNNDYNILVTAPVELRIRRVMQRDGLTRQQVTARMERQLDDAEKSAMADYIIINDGSSAVIPQVLQLHAFFMETSTR